MIGIPHQLQRTAQQLRGGAPRGTAAAHSLAVDDAQDTPVRRGGFFDCPDYSKVTQPGLRSRPFLIQIADYGGSRLPAAVARKPFDQYGVRYRLVTHSLRADGFPLLPSSATREPASSRLMVRGVNSVHCAKPPTEKGK